MTFLPVLQAWLVAGMVVWWCLTRLGMPITWFYARHRLGKWHYLLGLISLCPFAMEFLSIVFMLLATSQGLAPLRRNATK